MARSYAKELKKTVAELICVERRSTIRTAEEFKIPLKTVEKWVTAYNKNNHCFDEDAVSSSKENK